MLPLFEEDTQRSRKQSSNHIWATYMIAISENSVTKPIYLIT